VDEKRFSLKDHLFNAEKVSYLGGLLETGVDPFDRERFESAVMAELGGLELKQRIALIARELETHLDDDFDLACAQIVASLPPPLDPSRSDDDFGDFIIAPFGDFVANNGLTHYETAMSTLLELTKRFSMEGAVRPFIDARPDETLEIFSEWAEDGNYHVRRLVSEGTRPRLPWAPRISIDVRAPLPLLDALHADPTRYVTRSVSNHLNDITKVDPEVVISALGKWRQEGRQEPGELDWMTRHALRTLIKLGHRQTMAMLGHSPDPEVSSEPIQLDTPVVPAGESLTFSVTLAANADEKLIVDYTIDFVRKDGTRRPKVYKLGKLEMGAGHTATLHKSHRLHANATTYSLYPGTHTLTVTANGKPMATTDFEVTTG
jgi:3-methyladenine DNA glycosylase AlkC